MAVIKFVKRLLLLGTLLSSTTVLAEDLEKVLEDARKALGKGAYKQVLAKLDSCTAANHCAEALLLKAQALWGDQDQGAAHKLFLEALELCSVEPAVPSEEERVFLEEAQECYFCENEGLSKREEAREFLERFSPVLDSHPQFHSLAFYVAAAEANLGAFDRFFTHFFQAYQHNPDHHMAWKTLGLLRVKYSERLGWNDGREEQRLFAREAFREAREKAPGDQSLYGLIYSLSPEEEKKWVLVDNIQRFLEQGIRIPRSDLLPYLNHLLEAGEFDLAERVLDKGESWYRFSRSLEAARRRLDQARKSVLAENN